jgi:hypothetical protein
MTTMADWLKEQFCNLLYLAEISMQSISFKKINKIPHFFISSHKGHDFPEELLNVSKNTVISPLPNISFLQISLYYCFPFHLSSKYSGANGSSNVVSYPKSKKMLHFLLSQIMAQ